MSNTIADLSAKQLREAAEIKEKIAALQTELNRLVGDGKPGKSKAKTKSKMTPEARAKIGAAQKKIWAERKAKARKGKKTTS